MIDLKEFRRQNNLTQTELGSYLGIQKSFLSKIENGKEKLPVDKFQKLLDNECGWDVSSIMRPVAVIQKIGDKSSNNMQLANSAECAVLQERVKHLEDLVQEKERMIQILLDKR